MQPESSSPETIQPTPVRTYRQAGIVQGIRWLSLALIVSLPWLAPFVLSQFVDDDFPEFIRRAVGLVATMASVTGVFVVVSDRGSLCVANALCDHDRHRSGCLCSRSPDHSRRRILRQFKIQDSLCLG